MAPAPASDPVPARVVVWTDYLCPWCFLARPRIAWVAARARVEHRALEIHPEIPADGIARSDLPRRDDHTADRLRFVAEEEGVDLSFPDVVPNTRRAIRAAECVRDGWPEMYDAFHDAVFDAYWVEHRNISLAEVLAEIATDIGAEGTLIVDALAAGAGAAAAADATTQAHSHGAYATPSFLVSRNDSELLIPGLQPQAFLARALERVGTR